MFVHLLVKLNIHYTSSCYKFCPEIFICCFNLRQYNFYAFQQNFPRYTDILYNIRLDYNYMS